MVQNRNIRVIEGKLKMIQSNPFFPQGSEVSFESQKVAVEVLITKRFLKGLQKGKESVLRGGVF